jgi:hypothetical protein
MIATTARLSHRAVAPRADFHARFFFCLRAC